MTLEELRRVIESAGGGPNALVYAESLLEKVNRLEATRRYDKLLTQLRSANEPGDFRGRLLEVNFADAFVRKSIQLTYGALQGMTGDIDFQWSVQEHELFIEIKLLGQDRATRDDINHQLESQGVSATLISEDTRDVGRIQLDILQKSSTRKFSPHPGAHWINLVAIDVAELQLGTVDICDCLLAAGGQSRRLTALRPGQHARERDRYLRTNRWANVDSRSRRVGRTDSPANAGSTAPAHVYPWCGIPLQEAQRDGSVDVRANRRCRMEQRARHRGCRSLDSWRSARGAAKLDRLNGHLASTSPTNCVLGKWRSAEE
jgi:hypothetical protein